MILYCDPSARAFGMVIIDNHTIRSVSVYDFIQGNKGTMPEISRLITSGLLLALKINHEETRFTKIVTELPVGSQNARAAWYLSAVQSTLFSFARLSGIEILGHKENEIKKIVHGRVKKVDKKDTIKFVFDKLPEFAYILPGNNQVTQQALADTLAVYYAHCWGESG
jgi:Holliday junction resolvasome RuvABC endonuclease subunit